MYENHVSESYVIQVVYREHIQQKQSVKLVGLVENHIGRRVLVEQGMEHCVDRRYISFLDLLNDQVVGFYYAVVA